MESPPRLARQSIDTVVKIHRLLMDFDDTKIHSSSSLRIARRAVEIRRDAYTMGGNVAVRVSPRHCRQMEKRYTGVITAGV